MSNLAGLESARSGSILFSSTLVVLYYDHLLTLESEIRLLWKRPKNAGVYVFFLNRYIAFFGNIVAAFSLFSTSLTPSRSVICGHNPERVIFTIE
ncbi:hypothetical protein GYMLUDRAFT_969754 [Collybiopsis luxurians FD-317 M1]|uniref:DUF6533 domain-containing protein n=1 Tax=Collybiopsis luxurians FD-317 M1 TaxID=944289 RepID=A0A0D0CBL9_9AGAR|nr:hypothetical protein GYMLUDRAFT_969754 [Collybiopsis luxurians FD-317 M1]